jgi:hypothetical protein
VPAEALPASATGWSCGACTAASSPRCLSPPRRSAWRSRRWAAFRVTSPRRPKQTTQALARRCRGATMPRGEPCEKRLVVLPPISPTLPFCPLHPPRFGRIRESPGVVRERTSLICYGPFHLRRKRFVSLSSSPCSDPSARRYRPLLAASLSCVFLCGLCALARTLFFWVRRVMLPALVSN